MKQQNKGMMGKHRPSPLAILLLLSDHIWRTLKGHSLSLYAHKEDTG